MEELQQSSLKKKLAIRKVRYALKCLLKEHKVKKVRGFGTERIDYFYQIMNMNSDRNRRR